MTFTIILDTYDTQAQIIGIVVSLVDDSQVKV